MKEAAVYDHVGPYRILRHLKKGGQGNVFLGYDARLHRKVAIKIYRLPPSRAGRRLLLKEARLVADIQSPRVVAIHDVIESDEHLALVMEYVAGCTLEEFLNDTHPLVVHRALCLSRRRGRARTVAAAPHRAR